MRSYENIFFYLLAFLLVFFSRDNFFFWDTIQFASLHPHYYIENDFQAILLPEKLDSGHPPFFGIYIAICWSIFGKSLFVSHFAMLPALLGIVYFLNKIGSHFLGIQYGFLLCLLLFCDPVFLGQSVLVSPDVYLMLFFLMSFAGILKNRSIFIVLGMLGLALISMRGMMCILLLFLFQFYKIFFIEKEKISFKTLFSKGISYIPGGLAGVSFLAYHYIETGWIGYHEGSSWAESFEQTGFKGSIKNIAILGWRTLDFGRVFLFILLLFVAFKKRFKIKSGFQQMKEIHVLLLLAILILTPSMIFHKGLLAHRYLWPILFIINLIFLMGLQHMLTVSNVWFKRLAVAGALLLFTGNFWIYPAQIAQGWDATLAHWPYYELRNQMIKYIDENDIPYDQIGSSFPNLGTFENIDLNNRPQQFTPRESSQCKFLFYSNIFNDYNDAEIEFALAKMTLLKSFEKRGVYVHLYQK